MLSSSIIVRRIHIKFVFQLFSLLGIAVSIWMFMDSTLPLHFTQESNDYLISIVIILLASILLFIASILGLYSVSREVRKALVVVSIKIDKFTINFIRIHFEYTKLY